VLEKKKKKAQIPYKEKTKGGPQNEEKKGKMVGTRDEERKFVNTKSNSKHCEETKG